ncbi:MAG: hypothetical protein HQL84_09235 [Magnetococcales bacterium]|nr:hypothetical protein [Magnetococcales bacterium]MBF0150215.1 hypothetical protein [Magnetococcales bacterium]MBF0172547.1 hypothetical protein [Magnetococcales bacterium]MBF0347074.1 hypothetical protein [Magnetococcales bacterium]MBF0630000.1 hypothetical protein [Magnetococcales bacterium]
MLDEQDQELISRGLEADLNRAEMRHLYRLAVTQPPALEEMAQLLGLEHGFQEALQQERRMVVGTNLTGKAVAAMVAGQAQRNSFGSFVRHLWAWFFSPRTVLLQPFSFVGGVAAVVLALGLFPSMDRDLVRPGGVTSVSTPPRLAIQDVQFNQAEARVNWTNRFVVPPGAATRLSLNNGGKDPVLLQFESVQPASLEVIHYAGGVSGETVRLFTIDGIGFATLREPRQGDEVVVRNSGNVPVLVYMRGMDGATVSDLQNLQQKDKTRQNL